MSEIKEIGTLLKPHLPSGSAIISQKTSTLTSPGDNYGSLMLKIEVTIKTGDKEEVMDLVGKQIPQNKWLQDMFQIQYTFVKEMEFYNTIVPSLKKFQVEQGMKSVMDFFPKFFGGRKNLNPISSVVDEDGVLLFENLKMQGYIIIDRICGLNLDVTRIVLNNLATFLAIPLALKLKKPNVFEESLMPYLRHINLFTDDVKYCADTMLNKYGSITGDDEECAKLYSRVKNSVLSSLSESEKRRESCFNTIIHNDFWVNNTMIKFSGTEPIESKMIDFQIIEYGSLAKDVIFFLYSSVQTSVLKQHFDNLLRYYFDRFVANLKELSCDIKLFSMESFMNELKIHADVEFFHLMLMLKPIFASPHQLKDIKDLSEEDLKSDYIPKRVQEKCCFIIKDFVNRNWI